MHLLTDVIGDLIQGCQIVGKVALFGTHIRIMPAEKRHVQQIEHLKGHIRLHLGAAHIILGMPGANEGLAAKRIAALPGEAVPIGNGKAQMILHPFAHDHFIGVVVAEGHGVGAVRTFIFDGRDAVEKLRAHVTVLDLCGPGPNARGAIGYFQSVVLSAASPGFLPRMIIDKRSSSVTSSMSTVPTSAPFFMTDARSHSSITACTS